MYKIVLVALLVYFKGVHACSYNSQAGACLILDELAPNCGECSPQTYEFVNRLPTSLTAETTIGPCGCVTRVFDPNLLYTFCVTVGSISGYPPLFQYDCLRDKQIIAANILGNEACNGCEALPTSTPTPDSMPSPTPVPTPTPASAPEFSPSPTPNPVSAPTPDTVPASAPEFSPSPTPNPPPPPGNGGISCIAQDQIVLEENKGKINVSSLEIGNRVMTHKGFQDFMGYIHEGSLQYTLIITIDTKKTIELTEDHLIKVKNTYVHAKHVKVGDHLSSGKVLKVTEGRSFVVSPLTRSGTILVNDVVLSCYANVFSHSVANFMLVPLRVNMVKNVNNYFSTLIAVYNVLPRWFKNIIAEKDSYTF